MAEQKTKNDMGWEILFEQHNILKRVEENGIFHISATEINCVREARLMTKFDHTVNLPKVFERNSLSILPDSRGTYVIGHFDCYHQLPTYKPQDIQEANLPSELESISAEDIYSEPTALLCAYHAGLIADSIGQQLELTVFGRMSTGKFDFSIFDVKAQKQREITVTNAQCEIDGGYECNQAFAIIEAKNQAVSDFNVRQLYYPYRLWRQKIRKPVIPVFFTYSNEIFSFYIYRFDHSDNYNSLSLLEKKHYRIVPTEFSIEDVRRIIAHSPVKPEPNDIPFPQADAFERVIDLLMTLYSAKGSLTQEEITTNYDFNVRQTQYYTNAARYLGLLETGRGLEVTYSLTLLGKQLTEKSAKSRNLALVELILSHQVFREVMVACLMNGNIPPTNLIMNIMKNAKLSLNETTAKRRSQTVIGWIKWIMNLTRDGE